MIFYMQMRWNIEGRMAVDEVWDLEIEESKAAKDGFKILHMYKVAGQRRVIAIIETESAETLDRMILGRFLCVKFSNSKPSGPSEASTDFLKTVRPTSEQRRYQQEHPYLFS